MTLVHRKAWGSGRFSNNFFDIRFSWVLDGFVMFQECSVRSLGHSVRSKIILVMLKIIVIKLPNATTVPFWKHSSCILGLLWKRSGHTRNIRGVGWFSIISKHPDLVPSPGWAPSSFHFWLLQPFVGCCQFKFRAWFEIISYSRRRRRRLKLLEKRSNFSGGFQKAFREDTLWY